MAPLSARTLQACDERVALPAYDRNEVTAGVVHVGVGGFHRAHQAVYHDELLAGGHLEWGICGVGVLPGDRRMRDALVAQDGLYTLVVKHPDGSFEPRIVGSIVDVLLAPEDPEAVIERLAAPVTKAVTLTITEGGYNVGGDGAFDASAPAVARDLAGQHPPATVFGLVVEALRRRRDRDLAPFVVLSCDNLVANGDVARTAFGTFAQRRDAGLGAWVDEHVAFPNAVVDRITPSTTDLDRAAMRDLYGIEDQAPVVCEPFRQWVLEDTGVALPPYAEAGVRVVADVRPHELMKLRLLNGGHQALAYFGRLCGHTFVHQAARDPDVAAFLHAYWDEEVVPTLTGVPADELGQFRGALLERFGNAAIADMVERLTTDASDRVPKFVLPVVRERLARGEDVTRGAAIIAGWARYADGTDEEGLPIAWSDHRRDALADRARRRFEDPDAFLGEREVFGDLVDDERFVAAYRAALASLDARGARATLAALR